MTAVRTRRVWGPVAGASGVALLLYTVPANRTLILRGFGVRTSGTTQSLELRVDIGGGQVAFRSWPGPGAGTVYQEYDGNWRVFNPGDLLYSFSGSTTWTTVGYGVLLPGPPE